MVNPQVKKIAIFGSSGKLGSSLVSVFANDFCEFVPLNRTACDVRDFGQVRSHIEDIKPDVVINAVACNGIDACETDPHQALVVNTLFPRLLAELSLSQSYLLVHISSDAVFSGTDTNCYAESSAASPINMYGFTKYGGDCFVTAIAKRYYIARISVQFGCVQGKAQFVEKMLERIQHGANRLQISNDIIASPSYSLDVAGRIKELINDQSPFGVYHIANEGKASLCELIEELVRIQALDVVVEPVSHNVFPSLGLKNMHTPLFSEKILPLRPWKDALRAYCLEMQADKGLHNA